jgi:ribulose-5-phosphate 4-epimerase/fuculose-1-phosphate aldolase
MTIITDERLARIDLTAALRSASRLGLGEGICNHFSLAMPGKPGHFLINPQGLHWSEITCVMNTHMPYATTLTVLHQGRLEWASQNSLKFYNRVAYDEDYQGLALDEAEGERMCKAMGSADVLFLGNHGIIVCGPTVSAAFDDLYYLERACMLQVLAAGTGKPLRILPDEIAAKTGRQMNGESQQAALHLEALKRLLDRDEPGWSIHD